MATITPTSDLSTSLGANPGLTRLYDNVQMELPAITLSAIKMAAWNAIEDFYVRSTWRREKLYWQMPSGVNEVDFNPFDENWLVAWILEYSGLVYGKIEPPGLLRDVQFPASTSLRRGTALVALKPTSFSSAFDPLLFTEWFQTTLAGTLAKLYIQPAKPWSSMPLAQLHGARFTAGIAQARGAAQGGYTNGPGRISAPYFATGRRKN